ncbi:uncharacterized protein GlcG (DUF336 family) [Novosphingobium sp. SG751A]|uniref:GlcG/HbpS family heme-binding protein n=1 Tax=Novosphingobium sp. SG751A TaxID=2587000 RepID=UPI0015564657|nr:heme-binding protein [Novosphingobium sp. SG751A]NOW48364.1 uncharacterized protein GlcG (DUF336 family) [Novosphingobium sp. SG751A]
MQIKALALAALAMASMAGAQETAPTAMPDDMPPPSMAAMLRPPRPDSARPPEPPREDIAAPSRALALIAAEAALAQCARDAHEVGVAVSDAGGHLLLGMTMDGARPGRIYSGSRKNAAAVAFAMPTSAVQARLQQGDAAMAARVKPWMVVFPGAVPLMAGDRLVGAIGVSGATAQQDEVCAAAGAAAVKGRL